LLLLLLPLTAIRAAGTASADGPDVSNMPFCCFLFLCIFFLCGVCCVLFCKVNKLLLLLLALLKVCTALHIKLCIAATPTLSCLCRNPRQPRFICCACCPGSAALLQCIQLETEWRALLRLPNIFYICLRFRYQQALRAARAALALKRCSAASTEAAAAAGTAHSRAVDSCSSTSSSCHTSSAHEAALEVITAAEVGLLLQRRIRWVAAVLLCLLLVRGCNSSAHIGYAIWLNL
jgi:hypothetical protein